MVPTLRGWSSPNASAKSESAVSGCEFPSKPSTFWESHRGAAAFNGNKASMISRSRERTQRMETSWSIESRGKSPSTTAVTTTWFSVIAPL